MGKRLSLFCIFFFLSCLSFGQFTAYKKSLLVICNSLLHTQINDSTDANFGALVCPSVNPDIHPIHSRAAESIYPFAIAYKLTGEIKYRKAAIKLGNWLIRIQIKNGNKTGGWSESWPDPDNKGWFGTSTDQLISLAGAYKILKPFLSNNENEKWQTSIKNAADFIVANFPIGGNINYNATGAATLLYVHSITKNPKQRWLVKADSLMMQYTLNSISKDNLLFGEGNGVDGGYNIAQSIGYIALYGILKKDVGIKKIAANLLKSHMLFVYPNGSVDNSWGTRSYKWVYESGTKTAPGVYFSFALLADMDKEFGAAGLKCLEYLNKRAMSDGWINYGPHANKHLTSYPPCNYSSFARAQSIALAIEYGAKTQSNKVFPAIRQNWFRYFKEINTAVIRTGKIMATISGYGETGRYPRESVCRGGSITNLWLEGFGNNGFLQSSSSSSYKRIEAIHMPNENELLSLTPRIECVAHNSLYANVFEDSAIIKVTKNTDYISVNASGKLRSISGVNSGINYQLTHKFYDHSLIKEYTVTGADQTFTIIEPIVNDSGTIFKIINDSTISIKRPSSSKQWILQITRSSIPYKLTLGIDAEKYWSPFPGVEAFPIVISFITNSVEAQTISVLMGEK